MNRGKKDPEGFRVRGSGFRPERRVSGFRFQVSGFRGNSRSRESRTGNGGFEDKRAQHAPRRAAGASGWSAGLVPSLNGGPAGPAVFAGLGFLRPVVWRRGGEADRRPGAGRDSRGRGCEKGFSHQLVQGRAFAGGVGGGGGAGEGEVREGILAPDHILAPAPRRDAPAVVAGRHVRGRGRIGRPTGILYPSINR